jgi:hypothetical protein
MKKIIILLLISINIFANNYKIISTDSFMLEQGDESFMLSKKDLFKKGKLGFIKTKNKSFISTKKEEFQSNLEDIINTAILSGTIKPFYVTYLIKNENNKNLLKNYICYKLDKKECNSCRVANGKIKTFKYKCEERIFEEGNKNE